MLARNASINIEKQYEDFYCEILDKKKDRTKMGKWKKSGIRLQSTNDESFRDLKNNDSRNKYIQFATHKVSLEPDQARKNTFMTILPDDENKSMADSLIKKSHSRDNSNDISSEC